MSKRVPKLVNVLRDVNALRARVGRKTALKRLPKGYKQRVDSCPIANATGLEIEDEFANYHDWNDISKDKRIPLTNRLVKFVRDFDRGKYPWLIAS